MPLTSNISVDCIAQECCFGNDCDLNDQPSVIVI